MVSGWITDFYVAILQIKVPLIDKRSEPSGDQHVEFSCLSVCL